MVPSSILRSHILLWKIRHVKHSGITTQLPELCECEAALTALCCNRGTHKLVCGAIYRSANLGQFFTAMQMKTDNFQWSD